MGFFDRFRRVVKSNLNDMISKAENPEKMLNQIIIDMNQQLIESKKSVASAIADEKRLERQMNQQLQEAAEWDRKARLAVKAGKDDLAKEALLRKQEYYNVGTQYKEQWQIQHESVEKLKSALRQVQQKIDEAQRKKNLLIARSKRAKAQKHIQETIGSMANNSAFDAFEKMAAKVDRLEAEADAYEEIEDATKTDDLESQFKQLENSSDSADLLLEDLKKEMAGELEAPKPERENG
ncbi:MAG: PspA/IM30 family protein [Spirochaetales bacterium]|nr:PspA/IM30 family protein [Spirochaetales bacterium]